MFPKPTASIILLTYRMLHYFVGACCTTRACDYETATDPPSSSLIDWPKVNNAGTDHREAMLSGITRSPGLSFLLDEEPRPCNHDREAVTYLTFRKCGLFDDFVTRQRLRVQTLYQSTDFS